jgi:predicted ATP-grasp superfamily ATP-dependent carboligase
MLIAPGRRGTRAGRVSSEAPDCVVVGSSQNGLGVARALGRHGVRVIAVDGPSRDAYGATRYARRVSCDDMRGPGLIESLCEIGVTLGRPGVLILTLDRSVLLVSEHRARIEPFYVHSLPDAAVVERLMNKSHIDRFARDHGFDVPRTFVVGNEDDLDACLREIDVPCILKPQVKTVEFVERSPKKAYFVKTRDELRETWHMVAQWEPQVVVQEWIPGPDSSLVFCLFYFDRQGEPLAWFTGRKIRQFIPRCGTACAAEPWQDEVVREAGVRFFQEAGYRGFGAIEFKVDPRGRYYLIEPTVGRTEHIFALAAANGVNLPFIGYCDMAGLPAPRPVPRRRSVAYVDWKRDLRAARVLVADGQLTWPAWIAMQARPRQHAIWAWDDPGPFVRYATTKLSSRTRRLTRGIWSGVARRLTAARGRWSGRYDLGAAARPRAEPLALDRHLDGAIAWLCAAHEASGGGVSRAYSVSPASGYPAGWQAAYPETTGYLIPTFFDCAAALGRDDLARRAARMADWELGVQLPSGGIPGGTVDHAHPPVVFNTGMVLLGLARAYAETRAPAYGDASARAADFLTAAQARDGSWHRFANSNGQTQVHAYDCLVNWGLLSAWRLLGEDRWLQAAARNLDFTLSLQAPNGWFAMNALRTLRNGRPLTHTIGYATQGLLECGAMLDEPRFIDAARITADAMLARLDAGGFLAGEYDARWRPVVDWSCLTGTVQMAVIWWRLFELVGEGRYADGARRATRYVKCRQDLDVANPGIRGGIAGSSPVDGTYGRYQFLNWAAKFFVDALLLEARADRGQIGRQAVVGTAGGAP